MSGLIPDGVRYLSALRYGSTSHPTGRCSSFSSNCSTLTEDPCVVCFLVCRSVDLAANKFTGQVLEVMSSLTLLQYVVVCLRMYTPRCRERLGEVRHSHALASSALCNACNDGDARCDKLQVLGRPTQLL